MSSDAGVVTAHADRDGNVGPNKEAAAVAPQQREAAAQTAFQSFSKGFSSLKALNVLQRDSSGKRGGGPAARASAAPREEGLPLKDGGKQCQQLDSDIKEKENKSAGAGGVPGGGGGGGGVAGGVSSTFNLFSQGLAGIKSSPLLSMRGSSLLPSRGGGGGGSRSSPSKVPIIEMSVEDSAAVAAAGLGSSPTAAAAAAFGNNNNNLNAPPSAPPSATPSRSPRSALQDSPLGLFTKGLSTMKNSAIKSVTTRARHLVSQNKRRYQEDGFDLDMSYITENVIAMGFPAGDISSGLFGYMEGFYRNHMEEVIRFFDTHHKGCYKVYNLCSERLYDASLFEGKVACFPFDDHNCPPLQMLMAFCESAYAWLRAGMDNVVVVHCKAGMARTGLMICCLLLFLKFFAMAEEAIAYFNSKRCVDGLALVIPSQQRYVKYFERILRDMNGETPKAQKHILRGIRLHRCPYWIRPAIAIYDHNGLVFSTRKHPRTRDLMPDDLWHNAPRKGVVVFALPGERCVAELCGDFKVCFHDRHGDFSCWLNTEMMDSRQMLTIRELDAFDKRRLPSPGLVVEIVVLDGDAAAAAAAAAAAGPPSGSATNPAGTRSGDSGVRDSSSSSSSSRRLGSSPPGIRSSSTTSNSSGGNRVVVRGVEEATTDSRVLRQQHPGGAAASSVVSVGGGAAEVGGALMGGTGSKQDDIFSDSESEESGDAASRRAAALTKLGGVVGSANGRANDGQMGGDDDGRRLPGGGGAAAAGAFAKEGGGAAVGNGNGKGRQVGGGAEMSAPAPAPPSTSIAAAAMANIVGGVKNAMDSLSRLGIANSGTMSAGGGGSNSRAAVGVGVDGEGGGGAATSTAGSGGKPAASNALLQGRLAGDAGMVPASGGGGAVLGSSPSRTTDAISSPSSQRLSAPVLPGGTGTPSSSLEGPSAGSTARQSPFPSSPLPSAGLENADARAISPVPPLSAIGANDGGGASLLSAVEMSAPFAATTTPPQRGTPPPPSAAGVTDPVGLGERWSRISSGALDVGRPGRESLDDRTAEEVLHSFTPSSDFKALAADASVFTFGEDDDLESDEEEED
ncbi:hypothetical protein CBR_g30221 [Chara braunii]|uniref:Phosphatidylinositol-3,4,5-trisphosphate 3-phosphatase n=1 Tax=Chara braunii TaxID=69332 RepID=A0A388LCB8_CHABU|nr:hypothetical protein CBR_g30221 [Chara braunii]|eukprot:GBG79959.1 hypothetical protein CBR_g30221 [Chara braunii]